MNEQEYINDLIELHTGLNRQGPGDEKLSERILDQLPPFPTELAIADMGCGSGAGALLLAERYGSKVRAVDFSRVFLDELVAHAADKGLEGLIEVIEGDIGALDWDAGSIGLLWSEGAAYNITFEGALKAWRPFVATGGIAVISEMTVFSDNLDDPVSAQLKRVYPGIKTEAANIAIIRSSGFEFIVLHKLSSEAWWDNYYNPLRDNIARLKGTGDSVMQAVIGDTEAEMDFFREHHQEFGYTFYVMQAV